MKLNWLNRLGQIISCLDIIVKIAYEMTLPFANNFLRLHISATKWNRPEMVLERETRTLINENTELMIFHSICGKDFPLESTSCGTHA